MSSPRKAQENRPKTASSRFHYYEGASPWAAGTHPLPEALLVRYRFSAARLGNWPSDWLGKQIFKASLGRRVLSLQFGLARFEKVRAGSLAIAGKRLR